MGPFRVGLLGATGLVGQRLVRLLHDHPWFRLAAVAASDRSAGKRYGDAVRWRLGAGPPEDVADLRVTACDPAGAELSRCEVVLSALDPEVARQVEPRFAAAGFAVISNSSAFRQDDDVPLLIPEINPEHLCLLDSQRRRTGGGYIVTNPNCSVTGLALAVAPLHRAFGIRRMVVTTLQAVSGAGLEGPRAVDLVDNVVPLIPGEEEKIESELTKILGRADSDRLVRDGVVVSAHCHRVAVSDGHLEAVSLELARPASPAEAASEMRRFAGEARRRGLPSAPLHPVLLREEPDRPQPALDRDAGGGMSVVVGRIRPCPVLGLKLVLLSHNTVRGAAGGTLLNAELLAAQGLLPAGRTA